MRAVSLLMIAALAGCATSSQTYGPDGEVAYSVKCPGLANSWGSCFEKAGDICQAKGYRIISSNADTGALIAASASGNTASLAGGSTVSRSMVVTCKP